MLNIGNGIFATDSEAEKIIKYFEKWVTGTLFITINMICNYTNHIISSPCVVWIVSLQFIQNKVSTKHKTSKSLVMINTTNQSRFSQLNFRDTRELQQSVVASKLTQKDSYTRKCVYLLNDLFDNRIHEKCVRTNHEAWMVWNFSKY